MHLDNLSRNGKTQPCAALGTRVRTVDLAEFLENPLAFVCRNSRSCIVDAHVKVAVCCGGRDAHLTSVSNRLNEVMKVLTVVSTIFMPLTLLSGLWGMNIALPRFPGGDAAQFWWLFLIIAAIVGGMLALFRKKGWI